MSDMRDLELSLSSITPSPKVEGVHEKLIIDILVSYFRSKNFWVKRHVSLNFAWGNVLSEIDLLLLKDNKIYVVEVKSKKDKLLHAKKQLLNLMPYVDYIYLCMEKDDYINNIDDSIGIILYKNEMVNIINEPKLINLDIIKTDLLKLKRNCLLKIINRKIPKNLDKEHLCNIILLEHTQNKIKSYLRQILLCDKDCNKCNLNIINW